MNHWHSDKSSNINEVIRSVLNILFFFTARFHNYKKALKSIKNTTNLRFIDLKFIDIRFINLKLIDIRFISLKFIDTKVIKLKKYLSGKK